VYIVTSLHFLHFHILAYISQFCFNSTFRYVFIVIAHTCIHAHAHFIRKPIHHTSSHATLLNPAITQYHKANTSPLDYHTRMSFSSPPTYCALEHRKQLQYIYVQKVLALPHPPPNGISWSNATQISIRRPNDTRATRNHSGMLFISREIFALSCCLILFRFSLFPFS